MGAQCEIGAPETDFTVYFSGNSWQWWIFCPTFPAVQIDTKCLLEEKWGG